MKNLTKLLLLAVLVLVASCQKESTTEELTQEVEQAELRFVDGNVVGDGEEDPELMFTAQSEEMSNVLGLNDMAFGNTTSGATVVETYNVIDADRGENSAFQPTANFWWSETPDASDYNDVTTYFSSTEDNKLVFTEYSDGTASIIGTTVQGTCLVTINVWLKNKKSFDDWRAGGGEHKKEGMAGNASNSNLMDFYVIDHTRSTIVAAGGDCVQEGTFGVTQRPDPNDPETPNYGSHVGPGGANWDSNIGSDGLSSWGWLIDPVSCDPLWLIDFNFRIEVAPDECSDCIGKVTDLDFKWKWHNPYRVRVYQRYENTCYATKIFDGVVGPNDEFNVRGCNSNGTIGKWAYVYVGNCYYTKFRTDCYLNIGPGYQRGVIEVTGGTSSGGGELCEYEAEDCHW